MSYFKAKMHQIRFWLGLHPRPHVTGPVGRTDRCQIVSGSLALPAAPLSCLRLCRPLTAVAAPPAQLWSRWYCLEVVHVLRLRQNSADIVRRSSVASHAGPVGVLQGSVLGPLLFVMYTADLSRVVTQHGFSCTSMLMTVKYSSLSFIDGQWRANLGQPIRSLYWRCGCLAKHQPITLESFQDSSLMAGFEIFSGQDHCLSHAGPVFISPGRRLGPWPRRHHRQSPDHGWLHHRRMPRHLLSSATTMPDHKITVCWCSNDARVEFH